MSVQTGFFIVFNKNFSHGTTIKQSSCFEASLKNLYIEFHRPVGIFHLLDFDLNMTLLKEEFVMQMCDH